jgi:hypothetical protein
MRHNAYWQTQKRNILHYIYGKLAFLRFASSLAVVFLFSSFLFMFIKVIVLIFEEFHE